MGNLAEEIFLLPNGTFFVELAVFLFIVFALMKWILPPINKALEDRQNQIRTSLEAADVAAADAAAADAERRAALEEGRRQASELIATAQADRASIVDGARKEATDAAAAVTARAEASLSAERASTLASLRREVGTLAITLAGKVVGESLADDERARATVDRFIADLEAQANGASN
ncbi:MAG: F0F1 ATP synthase subunit B [Actinomycetes bacterium]